MDLLKHANLHNIEYIRDAIFYMFYFDDFLLNLQ